MIASFVAIHILSQSLQRNDFQKPGHLLLQFQEIAEHPTLYLTGAIMHDRFHSMLVQKLGFPRRSQALGTCVTLAKLIWSTCKLEYSFSAY